jgi:prepilin-type N-terminal cleavage/methylation domain-containing protein
MLKNLRKKNQGFTIIEVMIVLAIAGLIMAIVFIAVPALQRTQRDTRRKNDMNRLFSALETYAGNNQGKYPTDQSSYDTFISNYLTANGGVFDDPQGGTYVATVVSASASPAAPTNTTDGKYTINLKAVCNGTTTTTSGAGSRNVAVLYKLENGGQQCQSNQ